MYESKKSGPAGYVVSARGAVRLLGQAAVRDQAPQGGRAPPMGPALPTGDGARQRPMTGVEALIRWIEPDGTMIPPVEFIPLAEELGLIETIGDWVVNELVYQAPAWRSWASTSRSGSTCRRGSSGSPTWPTQILTQISGGGVDPTKIVVEVTESSAHDRPRSRAGDPVGAPPRRSPRGDRRLRDRLLIAVTAARGPDRSYSRSTARSCPASTRTRRRPAS